MGSWLICRAGELLCPTKRKRSPSRFSQFVPRLKFLETCELLVNPLQGSHENLLAVESMLGSPRNALAARLGGAFADPTPAEGERTLPVPEFSER
jgi:hypothetical protein